MHEADLVTLKTHAVRHDTGVDVYVAYPNPEFGYYEHLNGSFSEKVWSVMQSGYDFVLTEYPVLAGQEQLSVLQHASQVVVVTSGLELISLRETRGLVESIARLIPADRIRVIVNRWEPRGFIAEADAERTLGCPVWAYLPNDERLVLYSINMGKPAVLERPSAYLSSQLRTVARRLAGIPVEEGDSRRRFRLPGFG
jgi:pilus assembly protein CpaE